MSDSRIYKYPLFISYPRTGCHWINCVMELYFDRPRLREKRFTFLDKSRNDWMWFHDHDIWCKLKPHPDVLYMYRDPVDTVFSFLMYQQFERHKQYELQYSDTRVRAELDLYINHLKKYLVTPNTCARTHVRHENFKSDPASEFRKVVDHFSDEWDEDRCLECFEQVTKDKIARVNKPAMNKFMLGKRYRKLRRDFRGKWGDRFDERVNNEGLVDFFTSA